MNWYEINNIAEIDSPALLIYEDRVQRNISQMIALVGNADRLYPHVKTNKMPDIVRMMLDAGISKFKCATIAEAEMTAIAGASAVLIAHQLVGPKATRLANLQQKYPNVRFASLIDCSEHAEWLNETMGQHALKTDVFLDINNGMNRSGHPLNAGLLTLYRYVKTLPNLNLSGLHVYDGHIRKPDFDERKALTDSGFVDVQHFVENLDEPVTIVAGGTPTFTSHALREQVFCSPGTCVLWDWGYGDALREQQFEYAAVVLTRVISKPAPGLVCIDMGHKAVAAENPIDRRIRFLNLNDYELIGQSEEHGVVRVADWEAVRVGDVLYGVPYHVCPTVNLYDTAQVVSEQRVTKQWEVLGRKRFITV